MTIDVDRVAQLSKLEILPEQKMDFERQMNEVVQMADVLREVDEQPMDKSQSYAPLRLDIVTTGRMTEDSISRNAPSFKNGCFCVPKTVE